MLQTQSQNSPADAVQVTLQYIIRDGEKPVTFSNSPGEVRVSGNTGKYEERKVTIRNGRLNDNFSL